MDKKKKWFIISAVFSIVIVTIATVVLVMFYHKAIFTENTLGIILLIFCLIVLFVCGLIGMSVFKK